VDSAGKVRCWEKLTTWPYFRGFVALCSESTPAEHRAYLDRNGVASISAGHERVDLEEALGKLETQYGVRVLRADSGGTLNSALLATGLVSEISVLVHPFLAGGSPVPGICDPAGAGRLQIPLVLRSHELLGNGVVWLRYTPASRS
jgi:2,5-diamino-6-(ribosylamino)-4(3H)-pyrimidinone 5'-phosphate reductase